MSTKNVLLVNDDPSLPEFFQNALETGVLSTQETPRWSRKFRHHAFPFIIIEMKKDWAKDLRRLFSNGQSNADCYIIIAPSMKLKETAERIKEISTRVLEKSASPTPPPSKQGQHKTAASLALQEWVESKLKVFVKQMKISGGRNLYSMILREIEHPLIRTVLKETNGNQIQAAHLLGMNRNTLRKKIKELKIPVTRIASGAG